MTELARWLLWATTATVAAACTVSTSDPDDAPPGSGGNANAGAAGASGAAGQGGAATGCGDLTENGRCDGPNLVYCKDGEQQQVDCAAVGSLCSVSDGEANCTDLERAASCGDLTALGSCDGAVLSYCDQSGLVAMPRHINCAAYGQRCDPTGASDGGAICVPHGACPSGVSEEGVCQENELRFCEEDELYVFDCGVDECRTVGDFADCFMPGVADGCGTETEAGRCDGDTVVACLGNVVTREDCSVLGMQCSEGASGASCAASCPASCPEGWSCSSGRCAPATAPTRDWTVAVYIVGDNNLADAAWTDLEEMERVGSTSAVQIVTEFELSTTFTTLGPDEYRTGVYRMPIRSDGDTAALGSLQNATALGDRNMSDPANVAAFLRWAAETYPAERYAFILWDHGLGWKGGFVDSSSSGSMTLRDLIGGVRDAGVHVDLLGFDACLMGMHEVALSFRGLADVLVASEEVEPGGGYPYDQVLERLVATPAMSAADLGDVIVEEYASHYGQGLRARSTTQSAIDLRQMSAVNRELAGFAGDALASLGASRSELRAALGSEDIMRFRDQDLADLPSAMAALGTVTGSIGTSATDFRSFFDGSGAVLRSLGTRNNEGAGGLSVYLPPLAFSWYSTGTFEDYRSSTSFLPTQTWHALVGSLTEDDSANTTPAAGATSWFSVVLSWANQPDGGESAADLDLYVYEPNGDFGTPLNGTVTQNGMLSADSYETGQPRESYELLADHAPGTYVILAHFYDAPSGEQAYPRLQIFRHDLPGGSRTLVRGRIVDRELVEVPMDNSAPLEEQIDANNFQGVLNLDYSNLWYAVAIEVE